MRNVWTVWSVCAVMGAASAGAGPQVAVDDRPLQATVTPHVARAPAVVRISAIVHPAAENRRLVFTLDSDAFYSSSVVSLDGDAAARVHHAEFRSVPPGDHQVTVSLVDRRGGTRASLRDEILIRE